MDKKIEVKYTIYVGRICIASAFLALTAACFTQVSHTPILGLDLPQLLVDAILLSLLGTGMLLDAHLERGNILD